MIDMKRITVRIQGFYYMAIGIWPLIHASSYRDVYGYTNEDAMLTLVGLLTICAAISLLIKRYSFLGLCLALSFLYIDIRYLVNDHFSFHFIIDVLAQSGFIALIGYEAYLRYKQSRGNRFKVGIPERQTPLEDTMPGDAVNF
ncbi:hypothetical protein DI53_3602 [Sphingobacterium deserti]|uniref:Transmembrane protein n=2 Tax=Sphingobacterium deserti TaxID=1229276 RepID=A0A0B8SYS2_9SPHI|nr:hypothetical protein DI53_3602 [Sphingobacterium deserti]